MSQIINTNIASINAQRNLSNSQGENQTALERLSSGLRINSAADDAAGLAISTRFESQTRGLDVGIRNANDGISLAQTGEGALGSMTENLQRIRDLALQSANATNSSADRESLNEEVQQLKAEITRVSEQTNFNGTKLLDGSFEAAFFQIGANRGETVDVDITGATPDKLGAAATDGITSFPSVEQMMGGDLVINGVSIGQSSSSDDRFSEEERAGSAIAKAAAVNDRSDESGVIAEVNETSVAGSTLDPQTLDIPTYDGTEVDISDPENLEEGKINGIGFKIPAATGSADGYLKAVRDNINEASDQSGVEATYDGDPATGLTLTAENGSNITLDFSDVDTDNFDNIGDPSDLAAKLGLADTDGAASKTFGGTYTLISEDGSSINLTTDSGRIDRAGFQEAELSGNNSGAVGNVVGDSQMVSGDIVINGVTIGGSRSSDDSASPADSGKDTSGISKAAAINRSSDATGVTASVNSTFFNSDVAIAPQENDATVAEFQVNGEPVEVTLNENDNLATRQQKIVSNINEVSGKTGVEAEVFGDSFRLIAEDGRNIQISDYSDDSEDGDGNPDPDPAQLGLPGTVEEDAEDGNGLISRSSISLESAGSIEIGTLTSDNQSSGFEVGTYGSNESGTLLRDVDISTVDGANDAITSMDNALDQVNRQRANLGAIQNRFESTIDNQQVASENLTAANSRIRDADFAAESAELSRTQVLEQAGLSILSQANAQPQQVLQLLQG